MQGFDPRKPLSSEIKLHLDTALSDAIHQLTEQPEGRDEAIHKARKNLKKARALLRLCHGLSPKRFKAATRRLGIAGRGTSKARDAAAFLECASWLEPFLVENDAAQLAADLQTRLKAHYDRHVTSAESLENQIASAITLCHITSISVKKAKYKKDKKAAEILADGWIRRHRKAVKALAACRSQGNDEAFHDLRKSTQQTVYQTRLLARAWPTGIGAIETEALTLSRILGHDHDITLLIALEKAEPGALCEPDERNRLFDLLEGRQKALRDEALEIADALYSGYWKNEGKRIKRLWRMMQ